MWLYYTCKVSYLCIQFPVSEVDSESFPAQLSNVRNSSPVSRLNHGRIIFSIQYTYTLILLISGQIIWGPLVQRRSLDCSPDDVYSLYGNDITYLSAECVVRIAIWIWTYDLKVDHLLSVRKLDVILWGQENRVEVKLLGLCYPGARDGK